MNHTTFSVTRPVANLTKDNKKAIAANIAGGWVFLELPSRFVVRSWRKSNDGQFLNLEIRNLETDGILRKRIRNTAGVHRLPSLSNNGA